MKSYIVALVMVMAVAKGAAAQDGVRRLTLQEAIQLAVEKNLDVQAELYNPAAAEADIRKYRGIYNPLLNFLLNYEDANTQLSSSFSSGVDVSRQRTETFNAGVSQLLPTGGTVGVAFDNTWNHNNFARSGVINNYFQSDFTLKATQPLLRNFGRETTELNIDVAKFNKEASLEQFQTKLLDIITQVNTQYHQLYSVRENLESKKASLKLAETILNNTQAQVKAGVLPAMEILNAQFGLASRQKELIDAERALKDQVDILKNLLQLQDVTEIIPVDTPSREAYPIDEAQEVRTALAERPEIRQQRVALQTNELESRIARNQTLPQLDVVASAAFTGLDTNYNRDLDRVSSARYPVWNAGLQFTYPIGNDAARNDYIKSKLRVDQVKTQIRSLEETIGRDVRTAARAVRSGYLQLDVTARGRAYAEEVLQAYIKKQKVGLATNKDVLDVFNNLVAAQTTEIQAVADYNNAIVNLWRTTGELLAREGISLNGKEANELYRQHR